MRVSSLLFVIAAGFGCSSKSPSSKTGSSNEPISNSVPGDASATAPVTEREATGSDREATGSDREATGSANALRVTGIEPARGLVDGGTYVVIRGARFLLDGPRNAKVYFGSRQGTVVRFASDTELIVQAPGGKPNERVDVLLVFDPGGQVKLPGAFTFVEPPPQP